MSGLGLAHQHGVLQVFLAARAPNQPNLSLDFLKNLGAGGHANMRQNLI
jgi:hypothetical protein